MGYLDDEESLELPEEHPFDLLKGRLDAQQVDYVELVEHLEAEVTRLDKQRPNLDLRGPDGSRFAVDFDSWRRRSYCSICYWKAGTLSVQADCQVATTFSMGPDDLDVLEWHSSYEGAVMSHFDSVARKVLCDNSVSVAWRAGTQALYMPYLDAFEVMAYSEDQLDWVGHWGTGELRTLYFTEGPKTVYVSLHWEDAEHPSVHVGVVLDTFRDMS